MRRSIRRCSRRWPARPSGWRARIATESASGAMASGSVSPPDPSKTTDHELVYTAVSGSQEVALIMAISRGSSAQVATWGSDDAASATRRLARRLQHANLPEGMTRPPDAMSKWIVIARAAVFSMTATSGLIGGLLAVGAARLDAAITVDWLLGPRRHRPGGGARRQQHDQRLLRPRGRGRHRRVRSRALRAAPDPVRLGQQAAAGRRDPARQRHRLRDHAVPGIAARTLVIAFALAGPLHLRLLRGAADPAEAHRAGRARRLHRVGTAHGRRHLLRGHRPAALAGSGSRRSRTRSW